MAIETLVIQGLLLGGLYILFASGLAISFGIMRLVNLAHGDFIVLAAFATYAISTTLGVSPVLAVCVAIPVFAGLGYILKKGLLNELVGTDPLRLILTTFGLSIVIQNVLLLAFSADTRRLQIGAVEHAQISGLGQTVGVFALIVFAVALLVTIGLQFLFLKTKFGMCLRATSDRPDIVPLMGLEPKVLYARASAVAFAIIAIAAFLMAVRSNFDPFIGPARLLTAFEVVIIGGLGSFWGTFLAGLLIGLAQSIGASIDPAYQTLAGHIVFLIVLLIKPNGLFPKVKL